MLTRSESDGCRAAGSRSEQAEWYGRRAQSSLKRSEPGGLENRDLSRQAYAGRLDETRRTGSRQTENTAINTQEIMGTNGRHLVGGGDKHNTGETDQSVC